MIIAFGKHPEKPLPQGVVKFFIKEGFEMPFQFYGKEARNKMCQKHVFEYIGKIEKIVEEGMKKGEIKLYEKKEKKKTHEDYYKNSFI